MAPQRNPEEVINTQLEYPTHNFYLTVWRGLRVVIEGKFEDDPNAEQIVLEDARKRVRSGIAHIAAAVVYPISLRSTPTT